MRRPPVRVLALVCLLPLFSSACSAARLYSGDRADSQVAVIVPENRFNRSRDAGPFRSPTITSEVRVRVAGQSLEGWHDRFEVLPGRHDLEVAFTDDSTPWPGRVLRVRQTTLRLDAQAGHVYAIRGKATYTATGVTVRLWAMDGADRRIVTSVEVPQANILLVDEPLPMDTDDT